MPGYKVLEIYFSWEDYMFWDKVHDQTQIGQYDTFLSSGQDSATYFAHLSVTTKILFMYVALKFTGRYD